MVMLQTRPEPIDIDLARTALVVVDMQNSFVSKGGMFDLAGFDISGSAPVIEVNRRLHRGEPPERRRVVHLMMAFKPDLSDAGDPSSPAYHKELALRMMRGRPELAGKLLVDDTWDAAIVDALAPQPGEQVIRKTRYDGFCRPGSTPISGPRTSATCCSPVSPPMSASRARRVTPSSTSSGRSWSRMR